MTRPKDTGSPPRRYGSEPSPSPGWHVVPDIGEHEFLREAFEAGNGYVLVEATIASAGNVLPTWIAKEWERLSGLCKSGKLTWNEALAPRMANGRKVKPRAYNAYVKALRPLAKYRHHRLSIDIRRRLGKPVDDPLEGLAKDSPHFAAALGKVMGLPPRTALDIYNTKLPKTERYPYKSRKSAARKK